jgi:coenzyme F420-dependent glucose-6-phosphate dehydrogenase
MGAATTAATAEWLGSWADGLLTTAPSLDALRANVEAFRRGGGAGKPVHLKVDVCWAPDAQTALEQAYDNWRFLAGRGTSNTDLLQPEDFDLATAHLRPQDMISHDLDAHIAYLTACMAMGVTSIDVHQVDEDQEQFIRLFGSVVLPTLRVNL